MVVSAGGFSSVTNILSGGIEIVTSFGTADGTVVRSGGTLEAFGGASIVSAAFGSGGIFEIISGFSESGTTISGGEILKVAAGGSALDTLVESGSHEIVLSGAVVASTTVSSGGLEIVNSGALDSAVTIDGGILELGIGGSATVIDFTSAAGGTLRIDGTVMPTNTLSGFVSGNAIDLAGVGFVSGATTSITSGNVLEVTVGSTTYDVQLDPLGTYGSVTFRVVADGHGGTEIDTIQVVSSGAVLTVPALQTWFNTDVLAGGTLIVSGTAIGTLATGGTQEVFGSAVSAVIEHRQRGRGDGRRHDRHDDQHRCLRAGIGRRHDLEHDRRWRARRRSGVWVLDRSNTAGARAVWSTPRARSMAWSDDPAAAIVR